MPSVSKIVRVLPPADRAELDRLLREEQQTYDQLVAWLAARGCATTALSLRKYAIGRGLRKLAAHRFLRIDQVLSAEDLAEYENVLADPHTTVAVARDWLRARGYAFAGETIRTHRNRFLDTVKMVRDTARLASSIAHLAREHGDVTMSNGMLTRFEQVMLEQLMLAREGGRIPAKDLADMSKSVAAAVGSREQFEAMRREFEETKVKATEAAEHAAKGGATGRQVVERVREILGMPPLPAPEPGDNA